MTTLRTQWHKRGHEGDYSDGWPLLLQPGPMDRPQWGCNLGVMGTDGVEVTEECPSAGEWAAD